MPFAIKDLDTGEYFSRIAGKRGTWWTSSITYAHFYVNRDTAERKTTQQLYRWSYDGKEGPASKSGVRTKRKMKIIEVKIAEVEVEV